MSRQWGTASAYSLKTSLPFITPRHTEACFLRVGVMTCKYSNDLHWPMKRARGPPSLTCDLQLQLSRQRAWDVNSSIYIQRGRCAASWTAEGSHGRPEGDGDVTDDWVGPGWQLAPRLNGNSLFLNQQLLLMDRIVLALHENSLNLH